MQVHNRENVNAIGLNAIEDAVREAAGQTAADLIFQNRPCEWIGQDVLHGGVDLQREVLTKSLLATFIIRDALKEFSLGFWMKVEIHFAKRSLIFAKT
jgi:hypothetical protein